MARTGPVVRSALFAGVFMLSFATTASADHWTHWGWIDAHDGYPPRPHGKAEIKDTFGRPCKERNPDVNHNRFYWTDSDTNTSYRVKVHKLLGGKAVPGWSEGNGGLSTNVLWDLRGHFVDEHVGVRGGIYGYLCKKKSRVDPPQWSTHAWGIAIDIHGRYERNGSCNNRTIPQKTIDLFVGHRWHHGLAFCDPGHFQYATGY